MSRKINRLTKRNGGSNNSNKNKQKGGVTRRRIIQRKFKKPKDTAMFLDYVATGRQDLVEDYLDNGGNPKVVNCKGETALHIAAAHHQNELLASLLPYFNEDELDLRNMYGLPVHITAMKYGNELGAQIINEYYKSIKTKSYRFKNYSFKKSIKRQSKKKNIEKRLNQLSDSDSKSLIYPANNNQKINIWSYIPTRPDKNKSLVIPLYNNKNTKKIIINNKKKTRVTKKKPEIIITRHKAGQSRN